MVQDDLYFLSCMRYIEMNPVAAGMVDLSERYASSSYQLNAHGLGPHLLSQHQEYMKLGKTPNCAN